MLGTARMWNSLTREMWHLNHQLPFSPNEILHLLFFLFFEIYYHYFTYVLLNQLDR